jgi:serine/threonine-protein kinase
VNDPTGKSYIVMELLEGRTLGQAIREAHRMPARRAARIAAQIADALGAAHDKGIVHRDLKPDNVFLIKRAGSADYVKVLDFGMARLRPDLGGGAVATQSGALIGTPAYMSPEQARGDRAGPAADIYALGAVLFHMLTGQMPFQATSLSLMLVAVLQEQPPRADVIAKDLPAALADLVERALAKEPATRPADMASFRRELLAAADGAQDGAAMIAEANARASASSLALEKTLAPSVAPAVGQSSLSAAAAAIEPARVAKRPWTVIGGVVAAAAIAGVVGVTMFGGGGGGDAKPPAANAPSAPVAQPAPPSAPPPAAAPPTVQAVEPAPPVAPPAATVEPAAKPATAEKPSAITHPAVAKPAVAVAKPATATKPPATTPATPPTTTEPPLAEPAKVDRTKQLVGPKPPAQP